MADPVLIAACLGGQLAVVATVVPGGEGGGQLLFPRGQRVSGEHLEATANHLWYGLGGKSGRTMDPVADNLPSGIGVPSLGPCEDEGALLLNAPAIAGVPSPGAGLGLGEPADARWLALPDGLRLRVGRVVEPTADSEIHRVDLLLLLPTGAHQRGSVEIEEIGC